MSMLMYVDLRKFWSAWILIHLLCFTTSYAQDEITFSSLNQEIDLLFKQNDTTALASLFKDTTAELQQYQLPKNTVDYLQYRIRQTQYVSTYSKVPIDSVIVLYKGIHRDASAGNYFDVSARALGKLATAYRSKRRLDKAFEYNQKEIIAAKKSDNASRLGSSLITELDIAYNSLPWPIRKEDLNDLVLKSEYVIQFATQNNLPYILSFGKLYLSKFYIKQAEYAKAEILLQSISDASALNISFSKYEHLCELAKNTEDFKKYRQYTLQFKKLAYKTKNSFVALNAHNYLLDFTTKRQLQDSASHYADLLEKNLKEVDTTKYLDFLDVSYVTLANYFKGRNPVKELKYISYSATINKNIAARQQEVYTAILRYKSEVVSLEEKNTKLITSMDWFRSNFWRLITFSLLLLVTLFFLYRKYYTSKNRVLEVTDEKELLAKKVQKKYFELHNKQRVYLDTLKYIKADRNYIELHAEEKRYLDRNVLSAVLEELPPNFVQVHRSYVINKNFIKSVSAQFLLLHPNIEIPISRTFKRRLSQDL